jgi:hypothetical protein
MPDKSQVPGSPTVLQTSVRVVYEKASGKIIHIHKAMWRPERQAPPPPDIDADARRVASKVRGMPENQLDALAVDLDELEPKVVYAVDIKAKKLVKTKPAVKDRSRKRPSTRKRK